MAKYRVNGKFATLKTFVKTFGLDAVVYDNLSKQEKKVWNGISSYENRVVLDGKFAPKTLTENPTIKKFAMDRNETLKQYIEENKDDILRFTNQGLINRGVNSQALHGFIDKHKGNIIYKGKEIDRNDFLFKMDMEKVKIMDKRNKKKDAGSEIEVIYNFEVQNNGKTLVLKSIQATIQKPTKKK
jgi:hypothetical protein